MLGLHMLGPYFLSLSVPLDSEPSSLAIDENSLRRTVITIFTNSIMEKKTDYCIFEHFRAMATLFKK